MAASSTTKEQRLQLISECRSSGMSDHQWCTLHGINPGTFYNWVKRFRKEGVYEMPSRTKAESYTPCERQYVVEVTPYTFKNTLGEALCERNVESDLAVLSLCMGDISLKVSNDVNPELLAFAIRALRGAV